MMKDEDNSNADGEPGEEEIAGDQPGRLGCFGFALGWQGLLWLNLTGLACGMSKT
jgi:hypothetical protein